MTQLARHVDALQFRSDGEKYGLLERELARASAAGLEMRANARHLARSQLAVEEVVDAAKDFFARVAVEW